MDRKVNLYIAAPPNMIHSAQETGLPVASMIYRVGHGYCLYRARGTSFVRGGLMVIDTNGFSGGGPTAALAEEIIKECEKFGFTGVVLDTGPASGQPQALLAAALGEKAASSGIEVYVHEDLASADPQLKVFIQTALSGGNLESHLSDAIEKYGSKRIALEIERVRMDFLLPAETGSGAELSADELGALVERLRVHSFFSIELCAYYFSYTDKKGTHFVLYDNSASIRHKLSLAEKMGISDAFLFYPQVSDILEGIISQD